MAGKSEQTARGSKTRHDHPPQASSSLLPLPLAPGPESNQSLRPALNDREGGRPTPDMERATPYVPIPCLAQTGLTSGEQVVTGYPYHSSLSHGCLLPSCRRLAGGLPADVLPGTLRRSSFGIARFSQALTSMAWRLRARASEVTFPRFLHQATLAVNLSTPTSPRRRPSSVVADLAVLPYFRSTVPGAAARVRGGASVAWHDTTTNATPSRARPR